MPPTYRERLRLEGLVLAGAGALIVVVLLALEPQARRWPLNTAGQLVLVGAAGMVVGPRATRRALDGAVEIDRADPGSGEPTPLWQLPLIVAGLTGAAVAAGGLDLPGAHAALGWDAGVRVGAGAAIVGLVQALVLERVVAGAEEARGRRYVRRAGSRIGRGTKLGWWPVTAAAGAASDEGPRD